MNVMIELLLPERLYARYSTPGARVHYAERVAPLASALACIVCGVCACGERERRRCGFAQS